MATPNRSTLLTKAHRVLKKHFTPVHPDPDRPLFEQLLFAMCLENAPYAAAEKVFAALRTTFFDWNEIRVSSVKELSETTASLPDPSAVAAALRKVLQGVFESTYSFDLESLKKQNVGQAVERLEKLPGTTPFSVACVTQWSLGGHRIPLDRGAWGVLTVLGIADEKQRADGVVTGLERAIAKAKGVEFGSLLHQLGADFVAGPYAPNLHKLLLEISPDAKANLPKRSSKPVVPDPKTAPPAPRRTAREASPAPAPAAPKPPAPKPAPTGKTPPPKKEPAEKKATEKKPESAAKSKASASASVAKRKPR